MNADKSITILNVTTTMLLEAHNAWTGTITHVIHSNKTSWMLHNVSMVLNHTGALPRLVHVNSNAHQLDTADGWTNQKVLLQIMVPDNGLIQMVLQLQLDKCAGTARMNLHVLILNANGKTTIKNNQRLFTKLHSATQLMLITPPLLPIGNLVSLTITQLAQNQLANVLMILDSIYNQSTKSIVLQLIWPATSLS